MKKIVFGTFPYKSMVVNVIDNLEAAGFDTKDISCIELKNSVQITPVSKALFPMNVIADRKAGDIVVSGPIHTLLSNPVYDQENVVEDGLIELGLSKLQAKVYESRIRNNAVFLAVPTSANDIQEVQGIFADHAASNIQVATMPLHLQMQKNNRNSGMKRSESYITYQRITPKRKKNNS